MALNNTIKKFFISNSSYATVNFQGVMVQLAPRVTIRQNNTHNTREGVSREGSVSPRGMREAMQGAEASYSPPEVVAETALPAAGLSPSGWPSRETYRQAFP